MPTKTLQLHFLTPYAPSNLNRDDLGRPKTALFGGAQRLRVSSQSLKRAWRTSSAFKERLAGHIGTRTKRFGELVLKTLTDGGIEEKAAKKLASDLARAFGLVKEQGLHTEQLVHVTPDEQRGLIALAASLAQEKRLVPSPEELEALVARAGGAADIALFGRMLAAKPAFNVDAAAQVAHAISIHKVVIEDDYFTAVDDLKGREEDAGAGHLGTQEFASAVFYHYVCVDRPLLLENLGGDEALAQQTLRALGEACLTVSPSGKQNSFAARARAHFALVEKSTTQPRSLASAFLRPVVGEDLLQSGVAALHGTRAKLDAIYGEAPDIASFNAFTGEGTLRQVLDFMAEA